MRRSSRLHDDRLAGQVHEPRVAHALNLVHEVLEHAELAERQRDGDEVARVDTPPGTLLMDAPPALSEQLLGENLVADCDGFVECSIQLAVAHLQHLPTHHPAQQIEPCYHDRCRHDDRLEAAEPLEDRRVSLVPDRAADDRKGAVVLVALVAGGPNKPACWSAPLVDEVLVGGPVAAPPLKTPTGGVKLDDSSSTRTGRHDVIAARLREALDRRHVRAAID